SRSHSQCSSAVSFAEVVEKDALLRRHASYAFLLDLLHDAIELLAVDGVQLVAPDSRPALKVRPRGARRTQLRLEAAPARSKVDDPEINHRSDGSTQRGEMGDAVAAANAEVEIDARHHQDGVARLHGDEEKDDLILRPKSGVAEHHSEHC